MDTTKVSEGKDEQISWLCKSMTSVLENLNQSTSTLQSIQQSFDALKADVNKTKKTQRETNKRVKKLETENATLMKQLNDLTDVSSKLQQRNNVDLKQNRDIHQYNTRQRNNFYIERYETNYGMAEFTPRLNCVQQP
jgi:septal ring factor EnvC (AmiA/AmiB activator)